MNYKDKTEVYIVNRRHFTIEGGCQIIFREGQKRIYGISFEWLHNSNIYTVINDFQFSKNDFSICGFNSPFSFLDRMFFQCNQRETIAEAFQKTLRSLNF